MANNLTDIMPKILSRGLMVLRETAVMPRLVNGDYSSEARQKGDTIDVPVAAAVGTRNVAPSNTPPAPTDKTPTKVQIPLNEWRQTDPIHLTDKQIAEIDRNRHFLPLELDEGVRSLANYVNETIFKQYKGIYGLVGTPGTTPFASDVTAATNLRKVLNQQKCPKATRRAVLDWDAEANALALSPFADAEKTQSTQVKLEGEIGRKYGIDWTADHATPTHTAGSLTDVVSMDGAQTANPEQRSQDITLKTDTSGSYSFVEGDIITLAGDNQTYVVNAAASAGNSATGQTVSISPGLQVDHSDGDAVSLKGDHVVNLGFHRDAIAFANRPLGDSDFDGVNGTNILSMQDPVTGLVMRLEVSRQHKQWVWEFDILFGTKLVQPKMGARLAG